ncbi:hypothetical protein XU18_3009 [Perkinsela sp. CCAP 1560/4]|nr:hypothetical protein XU18_3009 [Perkinsela sp. CCAP 1560/4]|eukprot:KNH06072.1 hypothetical protein XU18_3009 [Perkinsela sp. CCAP 1560/4]
MSSPGKVSLTFFGNSVFYPFSTLSVTKFNLRALFAPKQAMAKCTPIVEKYRLSGEDFNSDLSRKYWRLQSMCIGYRVQKLKLEVLAIIRTRLSDIKIQDMGMLLYSSIRFFVMFMVGLMWGRQSMAPLILPSDPNVSEIRKQYDV